MNKLFKVGYYGNFPNCHLHFYVYILAKNITIVEEYCNSHYDRFDSIYNVEESTTLSNVNLIVL